MERRELGGERRKLVEVVVERRKLVEVVVERRKLVEVVVERCELGGGGREARAGEVEVVERCKMEV